MTIHRSTPLLGLVFFIGSFFCHGFVVHDLRKGAVISHSSKIRNHATPTDTNSFTERILLDHLQRKDTTPITVEGYVIAKRSLGKQLAFVDFQTTDGELCQAMLRQEYFVGENYAGFKRCLLKGTKIQVVGVASPTRNPGNAVLLLTSMKLISLPRQMQHIQIILQQAIDGAIPMDQVVKAANIQESELIPPPNADKRWLKDFSKAIYQSFPEDPAYPTAADQKEVSRRGNFVVPEVPKEWQSLPSGLLPQDNVPLLNKNSIQEALGEKLSIPVSLSVVGWVQNRRRFENNISMISLVDDLTLLSEDTRDAEVVATDRLSCILHPDLLPDDAERYGNLLSVGARIWVQGQLLPDAVMGKPIVWVNEIRLVQSSSRSVTIRYLLDLLHDGHMDIESVAEALLMPYQDAKQLLSLDATGRQWKANQLAMTLQQNSKQRVLKPELLNVMEKYQHIAERHPVIPTSIQPEAQRVQPRRMAMGMPGSKWQSKKRPQLEWMGQQIRSVLESHPDFGKRKLSILDIGGGKGSLANYLGQAIDDVQVHVVDICEGAVANGAERAKRLNVPVNFQIADASSSDVDHIQADVVVALHACGHLSDVALAHAVNRRSGFVIVPCCFNSNPQLRIPGTSQETVPSWLGLPEEDWSALKLIAEVQDDIELASQAMSLLCAVRADAVRDKFEDVDVKIRSFPIQYSTRNTVLVGMCG